MKHFTFLGTLTLVAVLHSGFTQIPPPSEDCSKVLCELPLCTNPTTPEGKCCPVCPDCTAVLCAKPDCEKPFPPPGKCCSSCPPDCSAVSCLKPACDRPLITPLGQCCPVCPPPKDCSKVLCTLPKCSNPTTPKGECCPVCPDCTAILCAKPDCEKPVLPPGKCCSICPPDCSAVSCLKPACDRPLITPTGQCCPVCPPPEDCSKVLCALPMCSNPTTPKGQCCPVCPICLAVLCPKPDCDKPVLPPGECCGVCSKPTFCLHNGRTYPIGSRVRTKNPCQYCSCGTDGKVHCAIRRCPRLPCDNPVNVPGRCCAVCPRPTVCVVGNKKYRIGSRVPPQRPCTNCFCGYDARVRCYPVRCPKHTCDNPRTIKGHCCPICPTPGVCIAEDGRKYRAGQSVPYSNPCKHCTCLQSGEILCAIQDCARPTCGNPVRIDGRCCPVCPPPGVCIGKGGTRYSAGDSVPSTNPCEVCTCGSDSSIDCPIRDCPRPSCDNPIRVPGKCCSVCPKAETCMKDGVKYKVGEPIPDDNPCLGCACEKGGKLICYMQDCARPPCSNPVSVAGRCCPVCLKIDLEI